MKRADLIERLEVALVNMEYALADARQDICTHPEADEVVIGWRQANIRGASEALQIALIALKLEQAKQTAAKLGAPRQVEPPPASVCSN
jgi:hypothetical protein